jgi:hypothetical protein
MPLGYHGHAADPLAALRVSAGGAGAVPCLRRGSLLALASPDGPEQKGTFRSDNFAAAVEQFEAEKRAPRQKRRRQGSSSDVERIIAMLVERKCAVARAWPRVRMMPVRSMKRRWHPVIVFSFSRRECEGHALALNALDLNTEVHCARTQRAHSTQRPARTSG